MSIARDGIQPGAEGTYSGGVALDINTAALYISGMPESWVPVNDQDRGTVIRVSLSEGLRKVRAQFSASSGFYSSAYYVYVRRVSIG